MPHTLSILPPSSRARFHSTTLLAAYTPLRRSATQHDVFFPRQTRSIPIVTPIAVSPRKDPSSSLLERGVVGESVERPGVRAEVGRPAFVWIRLIVASSTGVVLCAPGTGGGGGQTVSEFGSETPLAGRDATIILIALTRDSVRAPYAIPRGISSRDDAIVHTQPLDAG
ncbi:uncharacterized protein N7459_000617 [Penicillium hispanicum]|uniref:uncharacterized protein n=1 Tax=Penicillium hispanicum TaxID=1080232 RepID=UPI0025401487|nr:uncharacterized protein N7459_000617 [Penicillium hispanicum]KAJ5594409.1 hypothetical protein N7459_000617 [Penicillium hispanicum]